MDFLSATVLLLFVIDPFGNIPVFHSLLNTIPTGKRVRIVARELVFAYGVLVVFLFAGQMILDYLRLTQPSLSIAGGIILFLIAIGMVFPEHGIKPTLPSDEDLFIVPLAVPLVAGPSTIAVLLLLVSREPNRTLVWLSSLSAAWSISAVILIASTYLFERIGFRGARAIERLIGMLLIMMAIQMFLDGVKDYFALSTSSA
jgi:MarC family membrane protein